MKITEALINKLIRLRSGDSLPASSLSGDWVKELLRDGVLISRSHGGRSSIIASSPQSLEQGLRYIDERFGDLDKLKETLSSGATRSEQAADTGNSKLVATRSCSGFPVNSCEPIRCTLKDREIEIAPPDGAFAFIVDWQSFEVPEDVIIVNVENMENFSSIRQQRSLFTSMFPEKRLLFVSRYPQSTDLRAWLQTVPNEYVHFGDFDLAGINIFLAEYQKYLGERSSFLIPDDIELRLQKGSLERYNDQYQRFRRLSTDIPSLQRLIDMIHKYHRCYDQEGYIGSDGSSESEG